MPRKKQEIPKDIPSLKIELHDEGESGGQLALYNSDAAYRGLICGKGFGKTYVGAVDALSYAVKHPGVEMMITAPTYNMLRDSTFSTFKKVCPREIIHSYNKNDNEMTLVNGTKIYFRSTTNPDTLRGPTLGYAWMDEAAMSSLSAFLEVQSRMRDPKYPCKVVVTSTPKGRRHWLYDLFGPKQIDKERYVLFKGKTSDNPYNPQHYYEDLSQTHHGSFALQELGGEFVDVQGLVYGGFFNEARHIQNYTYNPDWGVVLAWDFGYRDPTSVLVFQQDPQGRLYLFDELYYTNTDDEDIVGMIKNRPYWTNITDCVCDPSRPDRIARIKRLGILSARGANKESTTRSWIDFGIQRVIEVLKPDLVLKGPRLVVSPNCVETIREFGLYSYPEKRETFTGIEKNVGQTPCDAYNHTMDALRYYIVTCILPKRAGGVLGDVVKNTRRRLMGFDYIFRPRRLV